MNHCLLSTLAATIESRPALVESLFTNTIHHFVSFVNIFLRNKIWSLGGGSWVMYKKTSTQCTEKETGASSVHTWSLMELWLVGFLRFFSCCNHWCLPPIVYEGSIRMGIFRFQIFKYITFTFKIVIILFPKI